MTYFVKLYTNPQGLDPACHTEYFFDLREKMMNPHVFREYDVRGVVDKDLNEEFVVEPGTIYRHLCAAE